MSGALHIPVERQFAELPAEELEDRPNLGRLATGDNQFNAITWPDLMLGERTVVLGEAKCGKTHEFKKQVERLRNQGESAFFLPLERLHDHDLLDLLTADEEDTLNTWLRIGTGRAYFFLDAVDELKLRQGSFRVALRKLSRKIKNMAHLARIYVSCRPADWNSQLDIADIQSNFPSRVLPNKLLKETPEKTRLEPSNSNVEFHSGQPEETHLSDSESFEPKVFALLPLTFEQVKEFASAHSPDSAELFLTEIERQETRHLFLTPIDVLDGIKRIQDDGELGNMEAQVSKSVEQRLQERPGRAGAQPLSLAKARLGAQKLALAMALLKKQSLAQNHLGSSSIELNPAQVLEDWTAPQQSDLLSRAIFDISGINSVRFYHRSAQEYLAAKRLSELLRGGLSIGDAKYLLFRETYGEEIVVPSMEPVASWLALWNDDIRSELEKRKPELLFQQGFPSCLSIEFRKKLIASFVSSYQGCDWRGIFIPDSDLLRLAHRDLGPTVRSLWPSACAGHDTRELFLGLIRLTPLNDCADLALQAALDADLPDVHRAIACQAVAETDAVDEKHELGRALLKDQWPDRSIHWVIPSLFPSILEVDEIVQLAKRTNEAPNTVHGLGYSLYCLVGRVRNSTGQLRRLRDALTAEIWNNHLGDSSSLRFWSKYQHFGDAVIAACAYDEAADETFDLQSWAWSAAVALHSENINPTIVARTDKDLLTSNIRQDARIREAYFWAKYSLADQLRPENDPRSRALCLTYDEPIPVGASEEDVTWLLNALVDGSSVLRRATAFFAAMTIWKNTRIKSVATAVKTRIADVPELCIEYNTLMLEHENGPGEQSIFGLTEPETRDTGVEPKPFDEWRDKVVGNPQRMLEGKEKDTTLLNLYTWLDMESNSSSTWFTWDEARVREQFSDEFLELLRPEFAQLWRDAKPQLWSERAPAERNRMPRVWLQALMGLYSEADDSDWTGKLTIFEAKLATRLSMLELNGFAKFLPALEQEFPHEVYKEIILELAAQLTQTGAHDDVPVLRDIRFYGTEGMKCRTADFLGRSLDCWPKKLSVRLQECFKDALALIQSCASATSILLAADCVRERLNREVFEPHDRVPWVQALVMFDLADGCCHVLKETADISTEGKAQNSVAVFATAFGNRGNSDPKQDFSQLPAKQRIDLLFKLVVRAYEVVRRSDDSTHEGVYSPGNREFAEDTRNYLLELLLNQRGPEAYSAIVDLSGLEIFAHMKDRLRHLAKSIAARASETPSMSVAALKHLDHEQNLVAVDHESLHHVMLSRLDEFSYDLTKGGFPFVGTLQKITNERELRWNIAGWLKDHSRGAYTVSQEAVTTSEGRTDIRLMTAESNAESVIELKLDGDNYRWTGTSLEAALRQQLVENYLARGGCQSGCLLICMRETRRWKNPRSRKLMSLSQTVSWLQEIAGEIVESKPEFLISVRGIDLTT